MNCAGSSVVPRRSARWPDSRALPSPPPRTLGEFLQGSSADSPSKRGQSLIRSNTNLLWCRQILPRAESCGRYRRIKRGAAANSCRNTELSTIRWLERDKTDVAHYPKQHERRKLGPTARSPRSWRAPLAPSSSYREIAGRARRKFRGRNARIKGVAIGPRQCELPSARAAMPTHQSSHHHAARSASPAPVP